MIDLRSEIKRILSDLEAKQICVNEAVTAILTIVKGTSYQAGDKVRIINDVSGHGFQTGDIVRLDFYDKPFWTATNEKTGYCTWLQDYEFELFSEDVA